MIVGAAIGCVTATVLACKATIKAQDILTEHYAQVESIHTAKKQIEDAARVIVSTISVLSIFFRNFININPFLLFSAAVQGEAASGDIRPGCP